MPAPLTAKPLPVPARPGPPGVLLYDELPDGSDVRREYDGSGAVTITAPAGEPSVASRRATAHSTGISSAAMTGLALVALVALSMSYVRAAARFDAGTRLLVAVLFAAFCGGVFLLVWKVRYAARIDQLTEARRESVVLHANRDRLLIERAFPGGHDAYDFNADRVGDVRVVGRAISGLDGSIHSLPAIYLNLTDGSSIRLMPGRPAAELHWVATAVRQALKK